MPNMYLPGVGYLSSSSPRKSKKFQSVLVTLLPHRSCVPLLARDRKQSKGQKEVLEWKLRRE